MVAWHSLAVGPCEHGRSEKADQWAKQNTQFPRTLCWCGAMPKFEWRLFLPVQQAGSPHPNARELVELLQDVAVAERTDVYLKATADIGVKRRVRECIPR